ncbi:hypothetical protein PR202_gb17917 [Eleusine coracana subsp. coracana]|uniref:Uncharacterized protein n=1 Tax=Eleusine coracana subsp. coracana TaxID=191504 RepID=A0AAV5F1U3_ELECO|nr:hypothetical protein QOZ80_6BG0460720 [Eleusine coracana subsp. coracana]GJN29668.1 hypothetical protein PR202_gb17917 [Eleusine coracana subsp. coracana]
MTPRVRALSVTHVQPDCPTNNPASRDAIKLSLFDTLFIALTPVQRLFFYESDDLPPFPALSHSLQSSLAATLNVFTPLAGKLTASSSGEEVFIDCSPDAVTAPGVRFVEAEYAGDDMRRLVRDAEHDVEVFLQLVPELAVGELPAPVLAVQVTRPADASGIVAVGVAVHHAVIDGQALWQFLRAWAAASRGGLSAGLGNSSPTFDRAVINNRHPKAEEVARKFVRVFAPALPTVNTIPGPDITQQRRRTYLLSADQIQSLKHHIISSQQSRGTENEAPSTYAAIASLVWTSIVRAKNHTNNDDAVYLMFAADCRARLRPPLDASFFGNCVKSCYARVKAGELLGREGIARAVTATGEAVREYLEEDDPMADAEQWLGRHRALPKERVTQIGASHRFMAHETDFGWGAPTRVELVSVFVREFVALLGLRDGAVQVSVALDREHMDGFQANFLSQLQG